MAQQTTKHFDGLTCTGDYINSIVSALGWFFISFPSASELNLRVAEQRNKSKEFIEFKLIYTKT